MQRMRGGHLRQWHRRRQLHLLQRWHVPFWRGRNGVLALCCEPVCVRLRGGSVHGVRVGHVRGQCGRGGLHHRLPGWKVPDLGDVPVQPVPRGAGELTHAYVLLQELLGGRGLRSSDRHVRLPGLPSRILRGPKFCPSIHEPVHHVPRWHVQPAEVHHLLLLLAWHCGHLHALRCRFVHRRFRLCKLQALRRWLLLLGGAMVLAVRQLVCSRDLLHGERRDLGGRLHQLRRRDVRHRLRAVHALRCRHVLLCRRRDGLPALCRGRLLSRWGGGVHELRGW